LADGLFGIGCRVERFDRRLAMLGAFPGDERGIVTLNLRRIFEHDRGEIPCRERAVNVAVVTLAAEVRQVAAMIDVRVAQDDRVNLFGIERELAIALDRFLAFALEEPAFEEKAVAVDLEEVHRARGRASRAEETDLHAAKEWKSAAQSRALYRPSVGQRFM